MKIELEFLDKALEGIWLEQAKCTNTNKPLDHNTLEQTRAMLIDSMFIQIVGNIEAARAQLRIISNQLY